MELDWFHYDELVRMLSQVSHTEEEPYFYMHGCTLCSDSGVGEEAELAVDVFSFTEKDSQNGQGPNSNRTKPCTKFFR
jgi:hypothetical protein